MQDFVNKRGWLGSESQKPEQLDLDGYFLPRPTPVGHHSLTLNKLNVEKYPVPGVEFENFYSLNKLGFRSDNFTKKHKGKTHALFAGCSMTFGDSIPLQYLWAKKVHDKINESNPTSGFFNVGCNGATLGQVVENISKYIDNYGTPEYIFVLLPDLNRTFVEAKDAYLSPIFRQALSTYRTFAKYCKAEGIKLIMMSWEPSVNIKTNKRAPYAFISDGVPNYYDKMPEFRDTVEQFYKIDFPEMQDYIMKYVEDNLETHPAGLFLDLAWDDAHPGVAEHEFWYNKFYEKYLEISS